MAVYPRKRDRVVFCGSKQPLPQIGIERFIFFVTHPPVAAPLQYPALFHGVDNVTGIGHDRNITGFPELFKTNDNRHEFHAVIGGIGKAARQFFFMGAILKDYTVAAGAGIAGTSPVGKKRDFFHKELLVAKRHG